MAFDELLKAVFDEIKATDIVIPQIQTYRIIFLRLYGFCKEISAYDPSSSILIFSRTNDLKVFVTDSRYRSYFSPDYSSHQGDNILASDKNHHEVDIKVNISWRAILPRATSKVCSYASMWLGKTKGWGQTGIQQI